MLFPWFYSPALLGDDGRRQEALTRVLAYPYPTRPEDAARQGQGLIAWNGSRIDELRRLRVPTLVLVGKDDILTPPVFSRELARLIPKAQLRIIPGGHAFFVEEAERFNRTLLGFLASLGPKARARRPRIKERGTKKRAARR
jgi:pimeloyl-ACP methyl ester carboxylesterase